jgi:peptidoglycan/LPS O-acetylase OafA/YrhL
LFLPYLEGARGFFGLYIVFSHVIYRFSIFRPEIVPFFGPHFSAVSQLAVGMFIVMSGYVLGLPVANHGQTFAGGVWDFLKKRAIRILPAYYAVLLLAIPISYFTANLYPEGLTGSQFLMSVVLHALLLHDLSDHLIRTIDGPMWSVAVEVHLYMLFPLLLVPLARRFGFSAMIVIAFALGMIPTGLGALHHHNADTGYHLSTASPWYLGLFALGYASSSLALDTRAAAAALMMRWPWQLIAVGFVGLTALSIMAEAPYSHNHQWLSDGLLGCAIACQFSACQQARLRGKISLFERCFMWKPWLFFGMFSYSLYLVHLPIIDLVMSPVGPNWSYQQISALGAFAALLAIAVGYGIFLVFERPFMTAYRRRGDAESLRAATLRL